MNALIKSKKADIPVTILVIGVFIICGLTIFSFIVSTSLSKKHGLGNGLFEEIHSDIEKFYFYLNTGDSKEIAAEKINAEIKGDDTLFIEKSNEIILVEYTKNLEE